MTTHGARELASLALLAFVGTGCGQQTEPDCIVHPCPPPMAIFVSVRSAAGGPVGGLTVRFSGASSGSTQCTVGESASSCYVSGMAGTYDLQLTAAGFKDQVLSVVVPGITPPPCGCTFVDTQQVSVVMTPR